MDRRTKTWRMLAAGEGAPTTEGEEADIEVFQSVRFNYRGEARCKVCTAEDPAKALPNGELVRSTVDDMLVRGGTYSSVLIRIEPLVADWAASRRPSYASIRRHSQRHLRPDAAAVREILERRAQEADVAVAVGAGPIVTRGGLLEAIRQRGFEAIAIGAVVPSVRETLEAANALEDLDREERVATLSEVMGQVQEFAEAVRSSVGDEVFQSILALREHPGLTGSAAPPSETDGAEPEGGPAETEPTTIDLTERDDNPKEEQP
jgi:hypothetical protein